MTRFATVVTRDVSEYGAYLECRSGHAIPLHRLVFLQLERDARSEALPPVLRDGRVLSAVYRIGPAEAATGAPSGYALRFMVEPRAVVGARLDARSIA